MAQLFKDFFDEVIDKIYAHYGMRGCVKPIVYILHKEGDSTRVQVGLNVLDEISHLDPSVAWKISIVRYRKSRTIEANGYLWACVYQHFVRALGFTADEWHEEMCMRYFGKRLVAKPNGATEEKPVRTTTTDEHGDRDVLDGAAFWKFADFVLDEAGAHCLTIPAPDPFWKEKRQADLA